MALPSGVVRVPLVERGGDPVAAAARLHLLPVAAPTFAGVDLPAVRLDDRPHLTGGE
jgi:hypothetical protein